MLTGKSSILIDFTYILQCKIYVFVYISYYCYIYHTSYLTFICFYSIIAVRILCFPYLNYFSEAFILVLTSYHHKALIDRSSPLPAYQQIANDILKRISDQEWEVGEKLPSEAELSADYGVSRVTLRQAMAKLEQDKIIEKFQGKGAFIRSNPRQVVQNLVFPSLNAKERPETDPIVSRFLSCEKITVADYAVRTGLGVGPDTELLSVDRTFWHQDRPIGLNHVWFRASDFPDFTLDCLIKDSISRTVKDRYHFSVAAIENYIEAVRLDAMTANLLQTVYDATGLKIDSQYLLADGTPIEYSSTVWIGAYTRFHYRVTDKA